MWETDLVQARSDRARLPRSHRSGQMGIGTRECCHVPFVVRNKCFCCWCGKSFSAFVTFALGWAPASQCSITIQFGLGTGDPCYWLARLLLTNGLGFSPAFASNLAAFSVFISDSWWKKTHRYRRTVGVVEARAWCIVKAASSLFFFFFCILTTCQKVLDNTLFHSSSKLNCAWEDGKWTRSRDGICSHQHRHWPDHCLKGGKSPVTTGLVSCFMILTSSALAHFL